MGGGHGTWLDNGYGCSGSVSFALAAAGLLDGPLASGPLMSWGERGKGKWVTIYTHPGHVFMEVAGILFDTSNARVTGSRWGNSMGSTAGFVARHPAALCGAWGPHPMHGRSHPADEVREACLSCQRDAPDVPLPRDPRLSERTAA